MRLSGDRNAASPRPRLSPVSRRRANGNQGEGATDPSSTGDAEAASSSDMVAHVASGEPRPAELPVDPTTRPSCDPFLRLRSMSSGAAGRGPCSWPERTVQRRSSEPPWDSRSGD